MTITEKMTDSNTQDNQSEEIFIRIREGGETKSPLYSESCGKSHWSSLPRAQAKGFRIPGSSMSSSAQKN